MNVFSFSRLSKYNDCPEAFYKQYCQRIPIQPSEPLVLGKASHTVIESAIILNRKDEEYFTMLSKAASDLSPIRIDPDEILSLTYKDLVLKEFHPDNVIEGHIEVPLSDEPFSPHIQCYIDLWRNGSSIELIDWKTNRIGYYPTDTKQLPLYAWCLSQKYKKAVLGKLVFLRLNKAPEHEFSYRDMEDAREWAFSLAKEIQQKLIQLKEGYLVSDLFPKKVGDNCLYCDHALNCIEDFSIPGKIKTAKDAEAVGAEVIRLESALESMKKDLKNYIEHAGPVSVGSREFLIKLTEYWKWDSKSIQSAIDKLLSDGKDPNHFLSIGTTNLKNLGWSDDEIMELGAVKKAFNKFSHMVKKTKE